MKRKPSIMGVALVIMGAILISIPFIYEWKQNQKVEALEKALDTVAVSQEQGEELSLSSKDLPISEEQLSDVLELEIPSIQVKEMVLPDTTLENLSIALTQIKADQKPGEGNFTIAGHRGYRANRHFRNLPKVKTGEEILLHQGDQTFVYEITDIKVIAPTKTEVLQDHKDQKEITLITCTMDGKDRVMVKGTLKQST